MRILKIYYLLEEGHETFETETVAYDDGTKCLTISGKNTVGQEIVTSIPIRNLRKFSVTMMEREI